MVSQLMVSQNIYCTQMVSLNRDRDYDEDDNDGDDDDYCIYWIMMIMLTNNHWNKGAIENVNLGWLQWL